MNAIILKPGRERPVERRHPWIFSGAVDRIQGEPASGEPIDVLDSDGQWLARAAYSQKSQIRARVWTWEPDEAIDDIFIQGRIFRAIEMRKSLYKNPEISAYREIFAESDLIPGLIVDRYGPFRVVQFLSQGVEAFREQILDILSRDSDLEGIYERSDVEVRKLEGLSPKVGVVWGSAPPERIKIREYEHYYWVDVRRGHKTGFYLDQRRNRREVGGWIFGDVLDAFCYSGAFTVAAITAGAKSVVSVDSSASALTYTYDNISLNDQGSSKVELVEDDVFQFLRLCRDSRRSFDTILLDPPKFASTSAHVEKAARGYKDINLLAFKLLRPGGVLISFSCSGGVSQDLFQKIIADAALDAGIEANVRVVLGQADDHPVRLSFPEGRYLKGLICTVRT